MKTSHPSHLRERRSRHASARPMTPSVIWLTNPPNYFPLQTGELSYRWEVCEEVESRQETLRSVVDREAHHDLRTMRWADGQRADL